MAEKATAWVFGADDETSTVSIKKPARRPVKPKERTFVSALRTKYCTVHDIQTKGVEIRFHAKPKTADDDAELSYLRNVVSNLFRFVSTSSPVTSGVPQGSVIGPLLFLIYINDLPLQVKSTTCLFADDSLLYRKICSPSDTKALQDDLDRLQKWEDDWMMSFNPSKCEVIRITKKRNPILCTYNIHSHNLSFVKNGRYLGVHISEKLSWNDHVATTAKKANNSLAFLRRNLASCPQDVKV